jgi:hypothetical protein
MLDANEKVKIPAEIRRDYATACVPAPDEAQGLIRIAWRRPLNMMVRRGLFRLDDEREL